MSQLIINSANAWFTFIWQILTRIRQMQNHWQWLKDRQKTRQALLDLTDEQLNDVGISKQAAEREANKFFWE